MNFYDTSVLVAATIQAHPRHEVSRELLRKSASTKEFVAGHVLTELYSVLTRLPGANRVPALAALSVIEEFRRDMEVVVLTVDEQMDAMRRFAAAELRSGMVYDALIVECARKAKAKRIYTWNVRHFKAVAPDLAALIVEPE